jgi:acyl carrier protein
MNFDEWSLSLSPKVKGTFNLHDAVEGIDLDFFVVLSSLCGVCGNRGQANYSAANTFLDAFTAFRRGLGLPCSALALGPVEDVGLLSCNPKILQAVRGGAARLLSETEVIEGMELAIRRSRTEQFFGPIIVGLSNTKPTSDPETRTNWVSDIRYGVYYNLESELSTRTEASSDRLKALLLKIEHDPSLLDEVESQTLIRRELGRLITQHMANAEDLDDEQTAKIAVDSLMSIEIRGWARRNLGLEVSLAEISKAGTVGNLGTVLIDNLRAKYCV